MNPLNHVAIIMDGNGRWGIKNRKSRNEGHKEGIKTVELIIKDSIKHKIKYLTLFAFSTENWKRPTKEINYLYKLLERFLVTKIKIFEKNNIRLNFIGDRNFSIKIKNLLKSAEKRTSKNTLIQVNIALNYGAKQEIINSIKKIFKMKKRINEKNIEKFLYTFDVPNPDILIRTGNKKRLSNFLLWQLAYTEIFFEKKLWPDFNSKDFKKILNMYKKIKRNFGGI
ncbi:polyprenyl diphosphate synthase [Candidatus Pelagibacter sp. HIMB1695]|uniref:polyprenyl diphosphate synthase n=1 Tax=Candidatus Pelagibacter sp. HIMB1695 TaxID=3413364 RepID=UPI003F832542